MQGRSHTWQNVGEPLSSPDVDSQEAISGPNGRKRTVGRFEDATLIWSFEAHIETLKDQLSRVEARAERQAAEFAERAAQVAAEHMARIKALEGHIETVKAREGVENQASELAALVDTLKGQLSIGEACAERQAAESAGRAAQVATEHAAQIKTLEERIESLKAQLGAAETQLAERATKHHANIAAERVKTEAEQAKAFRAMARNKELAAGLEEERDGAWWKRRSEQAKISESGSAERAQWQLPSTAFDRAYLQLRRDGG
jgi:chromosome segregation ATPase